MENYTIQEKDPFTVLGLGVELQSNYTDFAGINQEKNTFYEKINTDGTLNKLKALATNDYLFSINEAVNNKMMYYVGVLSNDTSSENMHIIQFPKGNYLVVTGQATTFEELSNTLAGIAFGQILPKITEFAYVGGPNAVVEMKKQENLVSGEMWIPVIQK